MSCPGFARISPVPVHVYAIAARVVGMSFLIAKDGGGVRDQSFSLIS